MLQATQPQPGACRLLSTISWVAGWPLHAFKNSTSCAPFLTPCVAVCDAASCPNTGAGKRLVVAEEGAPYYSTPCNTVAAEGTLAKCTVFDISGTRTASSCADGHCYLAMSVGDGTRYVVDYKCEGEEAEGDLPPSNFGLPGDSKCPAPPTGGQPTELFPNKL